jgi:hypothetical protein
VGEDAVPVDAVPAAALALLFADRMLFADLMLFVGCLPPAAGYNQLQTNLLPAKWQLSILTLIPWLWPHFIEEHVFRKVI